MPLYFNAGLPGPLTATEFIEQVGGPLSAWVASNDAELCMSLEHFERYPDPERTTEHVATHLADLLGEGES